MRFLSFEPQVLRKHQSQPLPEPREAFGTTANLTVFRKLKVLDSISSYTHRERYYALRETTRFNNAGLWSNRAVWFFPQGTLVAAIESFVNQSARGWFAAELAHSLYVELQIPLHGTGNLPPSAKGKWVLCDSGESGATRLIDGLLESRPLKWQNVWKMMCHCPGPVPLPAS